MASKSKSIDEVPCTVCGDSGDYGNDRFIFCDGCNAGFHQSCYGLQDQTFTDTESDTFLCHYCSQTASRKAKPLKKCRLCGIFRKNLAVMPIVGDSLTKWVHVVCVYAFDCGITTDTKRVVIDEQSIKPKKSGKCIICGSGTGHKVECVHPSCSTKVHPSCALIQQNKKDETFYFNDIHNVQFRNPLYFCPHHNASAKHGPDRTKRAIRLIELWKDTANREKKAKRSLPKGKQSVSTSSAKRQKVNSNTSRNVPSFNTTELDPKSEYLVNTSPVVFVTQFITHCTSRLESLR